MKRVISSDSDSVGAFMSICPDSTDEEQNTDPIYTVGMNMMDEEEECFGVKKRRLRVDQVKALEKNFEVENKLDPERKVRLAGELGLQPRQVAVWFQNRRARRKTKQLDKDYVALKASHDSLLDSYQTLQTHNHSLLNQIEELKLKVSEQEKRGKMETTIQCNIDKNNATREGSWDSYSSGIMNEDSSSSNNVLEESQKAYEPQFVKIEEHLHELFGTGGLMFVDEQLPIPNLCWSHDWIGIGSETNHP